MPSKDETLTQEVESIPTIQPAESAQMPIIVEASDLEDNFEQVHEDNCNEEFDDAAYMVPNSQEDLPTNN